MLEPLIITWSSAACILALVILFSIEDRRRAVFLPRMRDTLDAVVISVTSWMSRLYRHLITGNVRIAFHYLLHRLLSLMTFFFERGSHYFERLKRRNRRIARTVQQEHLDSHLRIIAAHKKDSALSKAEQEALRQRTLEGK